ncbi:unnamed protein product [Didymodactylos carnosus]|uniref:G-protein coupled receptors family 1 profile domain-containing protein n=1 Tax=Didymodactylos carnosus TaxID=1234261 RepID=A0A815FG62_9BILA|nr:unnamed protein product [Didymodactylos carnosus]CAF1318599.1 unnamed protein product [Didymodactylos carnosus]CAF3960194.1 unnamed protein product [Didymodactylos carnosus]CAF4162271.1 unnamed protein product [Didymodactylos carnosus]
MDCIVSRLFGFILLFSVLVSLKFNIQFGRWFLNQYRHGRHQLRYNFLVLNMFINSICILLIEIPIVLVQCFLCRQYCIEFLCKLEGFISYLSCITTIYLLSTMSVLRYLVVSNNRYLSTVSKYHGLYIVVGCWLVALIWTLPSLFGLNPYFPEGIGFHCAYYWLDPSFRSKIFFIFACLFVYALPLTLLLCMNILIYQFVRRSMKFDTKSPLTSGKRLTLRRRYLKQMNIDYRFALAALIIVSEFILSWTPYAVIGIIKIVYGKASAFEYVFLFTLGALLAKISMLINPLIYIFTVKKLFVYEYRVNESK